MKNSPPPPCPGCKERDATIANLQAALNEMHIRAVDAESGFPCLAERDSTVASKDRASIVAFLTAEAKRLDQQATTTTDHEGHMWDRAQASMARTVAAQVARGDDLRGGE